MSPFLYEDNGGRFLTDIVQFQEKAAQIDTLVFDWDGVFHNGTKNADGSSTFSEVDSMGINMLRFGLYLLNGKMPKTFILTGETNPSAQAFAEREHFEGVIFQAKNKRDVFDKLSQQHGIARDKTAFFFDDILDLNLAEIVAVRFLMSRRSSPGLTQYITEQRLADYISANPGGEGGVRECCELFVVLLNAFTTTTEQRIALTPDYQKYWALRQAQTTFFTKATDL